MSPHFTKPSINSTMEFIYDDMWLVWMTLRQRYLSSKFAKMDVNFFFRRSVRAALSHQRYGKRSSSTVFFFLPTETNITVLSSLQAKHVSDRHWWTFALCGWIDGCERKGGNDELPTELLSVKVSSDVSSPCTNAWGRTDFRGDRFFEGEPGVHTT